MAKSPLRARLQLVGDLDHPWRLEAVGLDRLQVQIGAELFQAFLRCFVHADRLASLAHFAKLGCEPSQPAPAVNRNFLTCFWFTVGTLREFALALRQLRSALAKRGWLRDSQVPGLDRLWDIERRWEDDPFFRGVRNTQAFHVDPDMIAKGVDVLRKKPHAIVISEGEGRIFLNSSSRIGAAALLFGFQASEEQVNALLKAAYEDTTAYTALDEVFLAIVSKAGVQMERRKWVPEKRRSFV
jgi:hypothetical protein